MKKEAVEDLVVIGGLIGVQFIYAGNSVFISYVMTLGVSPFTLITFTTFATFLIISPFAVYFERFLSPLFFFFFFFFFMFICLCGGGGDDDGDEFCRSKWPDKFTWRLMGQLFFIAFGGVTVFQSLYLKGIKLSSPAIATAMPNLAPGLIFVIAWAFRLEKVKISCTYSKVKIVGTLLCVIGAIIMSLMHSTAEIKTQFPSTQHNFIFDKQKLIGSLYLMAAMVVLSSNVVLQAATLGDFPAPMSLVAITSLIGVFLTAGVQLVEDHNFVGNWQLVSLQGLIGISILGGAFGGTCVSFSGWAMKKRGPVMVSMFNPIATVCSVILSAVTLGDTFNLGSFAGMFIMFTGLYFVLWAKGKEGYPIQDELESEFDAEKPLLLN